MKTDNNAASSRSSTEVYILPLRNENINATPAVPTSASCLYPTFKEWKLSLVSRVSAKEWRLYPTFKEWKPALYAFGIFWSSSVYILPLRNENLYHTWQEENKRAFISYL